MVTWQLVVVCINIHPYAVICVCTESVTQDECNEPSRLAPLSISVPFLALTAVSYGRVLVHIRAKL